MFSLRFTLGILTGSIHATRRHDAEIENNIGVLREACITAEQSSFSSSLHGFLRNIKATKRSLVNYSRLETIDNHVRTYTRVNDPATLKQIQEAINNKNIELFKTCYVSLYYIITRTMSFLK